MKEKIWHALKVWGIIALLSGYLTFCYIFLVAYMNSKKMTTVFINFFGEADFEFVAYTILGIPFGIYVFLDYLKKLREDDVF